MRKRALGKEHPDTLTTASKLATTHGDPGKFAEAAELQEEVLAVERRALGQEHPSTPSTTSNLAAMHHEQVRLAEAVVLPAGGGARRREACAGRGAPQHACHRRQPGGHVPHAGQAARGHGAARGGAGDREVPPVRRWTKFTQHWGRS